MPAFDGGMAGLVPEDTAPKNKLNGTKLQCFPLYSALTALGNPTVNLFSLDIEGAEFAVLKTIPWDKVGSHQILFHFYNGF